LGEARALTVYFLEVAIDLGGTSDAFSMAPYDIAFGEITY